MQLLLVTEGWRSSRNGNHPALRPEHDPNRTESVMVAHYHLPTQGQQLVLYDEVRDANGTITELVMVDRMSDEEGAVSSRALEAIALGYRRGLGEEEPAA